LSIREQSIFLTIGNVFTQGALMVQSIILARILTSADFGSFRQILLITALSYAFWYLSLPESSSYFLARLSPDDRKKFAFQTTISLIILGILASASIVILRTSIAKLFDNAELADQLWPAAFIPIGMMLSVFLTISLVSVGRAKLSSLISVINALITVISICLPLYLGVNLQQALRWYSAAFVGMGIIAFFLLWIHIGFKPNLDRKLLGDTLNFSLPYWLGYFIFFAYSQGHRFLVSCFFSPNDFAMFSVGATELPIMGQLSIFISLVLVPVCAKEWQAGNYGEISRLLQRSAQKISLVVLPVFMIIIFSPKQILTLLFGSRYGGAWPIFVVTSCLMLLKICEIQSLFKIIGKTRPIILLSLVALIVGIASGWALMYPFGIVGPAVGVLLGRIVQIYLSILYLKKDLPITVGTLFALSTSWKVALVAFISCVIGKLLTFPINSISVYLAVNVCITGAVFCFIAMKFELIDVEDKILVKRWITLKPFYESRAK
jgi:O-antigen/teichoic acid export membrane protein